MVNQVRSEFILNLKNQKVHNLYKILRCGMNINQENVKITISLLFEYCKRSYDQSDNPEMHFYNIPELKKIDNETIKLNAIHLIDENLVRGGVDEENSHLFPWITRINLKGLELVEKIVSESEKKILELQDELKPKTSTKDKILSFISLYENNENVKMKVIEVTQNIISQTLNFFK